MKKILSMLVLFILLGANFSFAMTKKDVEQYLGKKVMIYANYGILGSISAVGIVEDFGQTCFEGDKDKNESATCYDAIYIRTENNEIKKIVVDAIEWIKEQK